MLMSSFDSKEKQEFNETQIKQSPEMKPSVSLNVLEKQGANNSMKE